MKTFYIGTCQLTTRKETFEKFINELYLRHYKKERLRHVSRKDKRLPYIKVTSDIFSLVIYFKDHAHKEHRLFVDGTIFLNEMTITSITIEGEELNTTEYEAYLSILKAISAHAEGYILVAHHNKVGRVTKGTLQDSQQLLEELYAISPEQRTPAHEQLFQWFLEFEKDA